MTADRLAWWGAALGVTGGIALIVLGLARLAAGQGAVTALVGVVAVAAATVAVVVAGQIAEAPEAVPAAAAVVVGVALVAAGLVPWLVSGGGAFGVGFDVGLVVSPVLVGAGAAVAVAGWWVRSAGS